MPDPTPEPTPAPTPAPIPAPTSIVRVVADPAIVQAEQTQASAAQDAVAELKRSNDQADAAKPLAAFTYRDARIALLQRADVPFDEHHQKASQVAHDVENYTAGQRW